MNLDRIHDRIVHIIVLIGGLMVAIFCGMLAGGGQFNRLGLIFLAFGVVALCLILRAKIWILIPIFWPLAGVIPITDLPFGVRDIVVLTVFACFLALMGFKIVRQKPKVDFIDLLLLANVLYLCTVFVRNPVGAKAFNSEMVGGKPYFNVFIACLAYYVLCRVPTDFKVICRLPLYLLPAPAFMAFGALIIGYAPGVAGKLGLAYIYSDFVQSESALNSAAEDYLGRKPGLAAVGLTGIQVMTSYFRPLSLISPAAFGRLALAVTFMVAILISGFRSSLGMAGIYVILSSYFRRKTKDLFVFLILGIIGLAVLSFGNGRLFHLPIAAQRALSFLPGEWDQVAADDAKRSIEWRVDMWGMVWNEEKWIRHKWLGDGFGFTHRELAIMENIARGDVGFLGGVEQEAFMINGVFHNGPLSTIRFVGGVGLSLYYGFILLLTATVLKLIRTTYGTRLFPTALFVGMPIIPYALGYPFGNGQFDVDIPYFIFMAGLVKLTVRTAEELPKPEVKVEVALAGMGNTIGGPARESEGAKAHLL